MSRAGDDFRAGDEAQDRLDRIGRMNRHLAQLQRDAAAARPEHTPTTCPELPCPHSTPEVDA